ncbi:glycoside hydrolase family 28 protein [Paenibacillus sp. y28]|uniref:glycoside hydrolase family 28 protein n=1 Tax=Paenibacillus sp. y28 TaxID=3129110 RepID=UPI003018A37A
MNITTPSTTQDWAWNIPFEMPVVETPRIPDYKVSIVDYGAVPDGETLNTAAIHAAIEACAGQGGGTVVIPAGLWLTGPILMQSRIRLHTEAGALIVFSRNFEDYPLLHTNWEGLEAVRCIAQIYGENLEDVAITGQGIFDGSGEAWRPVKQFKMTDMQWKALTEAGGVLNESRNMWWPSEGALLGTKHVNALQQSGNYNPDDYAPYRDFLRPVLLNLRGCRRVLLEGPTFQNSPSWCLHPWVCEHVTVRDITVRNPWFSQNGDGIDLESCKYVLVERSTFDVGDDAICMKSGKDQDGRRLGKPCEYVTIRDCIVYHGHGGFVIGSEMSGGVRNIIVEECTFIGTDVGLRFKSTRGRGGLVEHIYIRGIRMKDIAKEAITFDMFYEKANDPEMELPVSEETPRFEHIYIQDTVCSGAEQAVHLKGLPEMPIQQIHLKRVQLFAKRGIGCTDGLQVTLEDVKVIASGGPAVFVHNSRDIDVRGIEFAAASDAVLKVSGAKSARIRFEGTQPLRSGQAVIASEVGPEAVALQAHS